MKYNATSVGDLLNFEYAKLIAIAICNSYPKKGTATAARSKFWGTLWSTKRKLDQGTISPSSLLRENKLLVTNGQVCAYCGATGPLEWEHIIPTSRGGPNTIDNLVLACRSCNT